jgi:hypothetical protein
VLTEKQKWKLEVARNTVTHITMVLEETFVAVFKLIESTDLRHAGFDAIKKMQAARDEMMIFINALDGVENKKGEERNMHDSSNVKMAHDLAQEPTERYLSRLIKSVTGPMPVSAGPVQATREGRPFLRAIGDDAELLARTEHVRGKNEPMNSFYARVGLGPGQIRVMSASEISRFVETVSTHEEVKPPTAGAFGQPAPQRFLLEV